MDSSTPEDEPTESFPNGYTAPRTTEQLRQYHKDHLTHASPDPIIPTHNIEERLRMIEELQNGVSKGQNDESKHFRFTYFQLAYLLLSPESSLRKIIGGRFHGSFLQAQIKYLQSFLLLMMDDSQFRDNAPRKENLPEQNQQCDELRAQLKKGEKNILQKTTEKEKCLVRDNYRCIFTQDESPSVHQIMPFIASYGNWTLKQLLYTSSCLAGVLGPEAWSELNYFVCVGSDRCDKSWNMISLGPDLRELEKKHLFGIQCLGILPIDRHASAIWLQFHWMPRNRLDPNHCAELNMAAIRKMLQIIPPEKSDIVEKYRSRTHGPLKTGHIFSIRMGKQEAINMKQVIDLRWVIVRIAAISGLARNRSDVT